MDVANFTEKSKEAISTASNIANKNNNPEIKDCHMVAAFLEDKSGVITMLFKKMDINVDSLGNQVQEEINNLSKVSGNVSLRFALEVEKALDDAEKQAASMKDQFISVEHLMLGILENATEPMKRIFKEMRRKDYEF